MLHRGLQVGAVAVFMAVFVITSVANAQPGRPGGGDQRGPGGPGGFGGRGGGGDPLVALLRVDAVLKEIEVVDDQKAEIDKILESARGERPQGNFRELSQEEREKAFAEARQAAEKRTAEARQKLNDVLLPHQLKRLKEISLQTRGTRALTDAELAAELKLSEQQKTQIAAAVQENAENLGQQMREAFQGGDREQARAKIEQLRKAGDEKVLALLSAEQKAQYEQLKGEPFDMPRPEFTAPGGRPGQGAAPGGQRRPRGEGGRPGQGGRGPGGRPGQGDQPNDTI